MQTVPGLSYLQMLALPREKTETSEGEEKISIKFFKDIFSCTICYGILKEPVAVRTCLHKFCQNCLEELHKTSKQCPQCRTPIVSRRVWRTDSRLSEILEILVEDIDVYNKIEAE